MGENADAAPSTRHTFWKRKTGITYVFLREAAYVAKIRFLWNYNVTNEFHHLFILNHFIQV